MRRAIFLSIPIYNKLPIHQFLFEYTDLLTTLAVCPN